MAPLFSVFLYVVTFTCCSCFSVPPSCITVRTSSFAEANPFEALAASRAFDRPPTDGQPHYCFHHTHAPSGMRAIDKLDNGELDIVALGSTPAANAIARGIGITVLSVMHGLSGSESLAVRPRVKNPQDLRGKAIGVPCGSTSHYALLAFLKQTGVSKDVKVVCGSPNDLLNKWFMYNASQSNHAEFIDGVFVWRPPVTKLYQDGAARLADAGLTAQWHKDVFNVWVVRNDFLHNHPRAVALFMNYVTVVSENIVLVPSNWDAGSPYIKLMVGMCLAPPAHSNETIAQPDDIPGIIDLKGTYGDDMVILQSELTFYNQETMLSCSYMGHSKTLCNCQGNAGVSCTAVQLSETASFVLERKALAAKLPTPMYIHQNYLNSSFITTKNNHGIEIKPSDIFEKRNRTQFLAYKIAPLASAACNKLTTTTLTTNAGLLYSNDVTIGLGYP